MAALPARGSLRGVIRVINCDRSSGIWHSLIQHHATIEPEPRPAVAITQRLAARDRGQDGLEPERSDDRTGLASEIFSSKNLPGRVTVRPPSAAAFVEIHFAAGS